MLEEVKDVSSAEESVESSSAEGESGESGESSESSESTESSEATESAESAESAESSDEDGESSENRIPHSRVKAMTEKAYQKGIEAAMRKLVDDGVSKAGVEVDNEEDLDDQQRALKTLEKVVEKVIKPYFIKQDVKEFLSRHDDAVKYLDAIKDVKRKNPSLDWEDAYKLASFEDKMLAAESNGRFTKKQADRSKEKSLTERPISARPEPKRSFGEELSKMTSSQIEGALRKKFFNK